MSSERLVGIAVVVSSACALALTALVVAKEFDLLQRAPEASTVEVGEWRELAGGGHGVGPAGAPATLIVFGDYQCPFCAKFEVAIDSLQKRFGGDLRVVHRHLPLETIHPHARRAALAAECAAMHGRFAETHRVLYASQTRLDSAVIESIAVQAGMPDVGALRACMTDGTAARRVDQDVTAAERLGLSATPAVLLNDTRFLHPPTLDELVRRVERLRR